MTSRNSLRANKLMVINLIKALNLEEQKQLNSQGAITKKQIIMKKGEKSLLRRKRVKRKVSKISAIS